MMSSNRFDVVEWHNGVMVLVHACLHMARI
jgi:hypothetical protein